MSSLAFLAMTTLGVNVILVFYLYHRHRLLRIQADLLKTESGNHSKIFEQLPLAWCYWHEGDNFVQCSLLFRQILRVDHDYPLQVTDILKILGETSFSPFHRALNHLSDFGGEFTLQVPVFDQTAILEISGRILTKDIPQDLQTKFLSIPPRQAIMLTVSDLTHELQERSNDLQSQKEKNDELDILRILADISPLALWHRDANGRIKYCNLAYAGALDTSIHRVIAENQELIDGHHGIGTYDLSRKAIESGEKQTIRVHTVIAGQRRFLEIAEIPLPDSRLTVGYAIDITELEDAEMELMRHINAHREVLDQISTPIAIYGADTHLQFFNHAYLKHFQLDESWLYSKPTIGEVLEHLREHRKLPEYSNFPAYKREMVNLFNNLLQPMHDLIHQPDGATLRLMTVPHPLGGLLFLFDDVTDKLALERGYNTLVAVQKETLDHLYEGIVVFGSDNRVRLSNPAMGRIWHLCDEERAPEKHINELLKSVAHLFNDPNESKQWRKAMMDIVSLRQSTSGQFYLANDRMIEYSYVPLPDGSHLMSFVDVSDRWLFEKTLKERTETLERTDRLKSDFISLVSYELRSPLNTITGFIEILINQYFGSLNERQLDYCQGISEASERLMKLINDMLDLASIEAGKLSLNYQETNLNKFLNSVSDLVHNRANDQGLELIVENDSSIETIYIDQQRLKHALFNLLTNAIKFTPAGGKISLKAAQDTEDKSKFMLIIKDTGIGINPDDQQKIFNLFEHSTVIQSSKTGAGLGLPLVKSLMELHGGTIHLESQEGEGTTIICSLPLRLSGTC